MLLTSGNAQTAPPFIPIIIGEGGQDLRSPPARRCSWCRSSCSRCSCASICCAASPLEPFANEPRCKFRCLAMRFADRILRRGPLEAIATAIIAAGVVMLMQPFSLTLYSWSFATTLFGT